MVMDIIINSELIEQLKRSKGFQYISVSEIKQIYSHLNNSRAKVIPAFNTTHVVFAELPGIEFCIKGLLKKDDFRFIEDKLLNFVDINRRKISYSRFLYEEFFQGDNLKLRLARLTTTILPLVCLNLVGYYFAGTGGTKDILAGILTAAAIFVAIFSLFTTSHDYLSRKELDLFESGSLGYYFSIDSHITRTGVYSILLSIVALTACSGFDSNNSTNLYQFYSRNIITITGLNLSFLGVYITLRAILEFYVKRPARFILGELKKESFDKFRKSTRQ